MPRIKARAIASAAALVLGACGGGTATSTQDQARPVRTVQVAMVDIDFDPATLQFARGETVRFVFTNRGQVAHDAFIGDRDAQAEHEKEMRESGRNGSDHGAAHGAEADHAVTVQPGGSGELTYTFDDGGTIEIGCHQPGHYDAGMRIRVEVT